MQLESGERVIHKSRDAFGDLVVTDSEFFRTLYFGSQSKQSCLYLEQPHVLTLKYTQAMAVSLMFSRQPKRILLLGLGGGSLVRFILQHCPDTHIDVVELREAVIRLAHGYFFLPEDHPRLTIHCADGLDFVEGLTPASYDMILLDVFDRQGPVSEFSHEPFLRKCAGALDDDGVLCSNLWNRGVDQFKHRYQLFQRIFDKHALRLALDKENGNVLVFAFKRAPNLAQLELLAHDLKSELGIDAPGYLRELREQNNTGLMSWF
jgi:spermidine synthase